MDDGTGDLVGFGTFQRCQTHNVPVVTASNQCAITPHMSFFLRKTLRWKVVEGSLVRKGQTRLRISPEF